MTAETSSPLAAQAVLDAARSFFAGEDAVYPAWIEDESPSHVSFATFRSNILVAAAPDPERAGATRVRVSSLRDHAAVRKFLTFLRTFAGPTTSDGEAGS